MDRSAHTLMEMFERQKVGAQPGDSYSDHINDENDCLLDVVIKYCHPMLGAQYIVPNVFSKYGSTMSGICDGWVWNDEINSAPSQDLWKMLAITNTYWLLNFERLIRREQDENEKLRKANKKLVDQEINRMREELRHEKDD